MICIFLFYPLGNYLENEHKYHSMNLGRIHMKINKNYQFRMYPTKEYAIKLNQF